MASGTTSKFCMYAFDDAFDDAVDDAVDDADHFVELRDTQCTAGMQSQIEQLKFLCLNSK
jgi:hypothetical protein